MGQKEKEIDGVEGHKERVVEGRKRETLGWGQKKQERGSDGDEGRAAF